MHRLTIVTLVLLTIPTTSSADAQSEGDWEFRLTPYVWLPTIDGTLKYALPPGQGGGADISVGPTDWLDLLNIGALVSGSARKGKFSVFSDVIYLSMTSKNDGSIENVRDGSDILPIDANIVLNTRTDLDGLAWTIAAGYELRRTESSSIDVFAGARYFGVDVSTRWELTTEVTAPGGSIIWPAEGRVEADEDLWDGIVGARGHILGNGKWSVPFYVDIGTGASNLTWSAVTGASRTFSWGDILILYRHLQYDQKQNDILQQFSFSGPAIGARFQF